MTEFTRPPEEVNELTRVEISLRRALATTDSKESRYHIRTALQQLEVVRETGGFERAGYSEVDEMNRQ